MLTNFGRKSFLSLLKKFGALNVTIPIILTMFNIFRNIIIKKLDKNIDLKEIKIYATEASKNFEKQIYFLNKCNT